MLQEFLLSLMRRCVRDRRDGRWISPVKVMKDRIGGERYPISIEYYAKTFSKPGFIYPSLMLVLTLILNRK